VFPHKLIPQRRSHIHIDHCAQLTALPSSPFGRLPLSLIWDDAGNPRIVLCSDPRHTTPRRRTPAANFQRLWRQASPYGSRDMFQAPSPDTPRHACRTTSTVCPASWRLKVFQPSGWSSSTRPRVPVATDATCPAKANLNGTGSRFKCLLANTPHTTGRLRPLLG
jgi:hypothetical protein